MVSSKPFIEAGFPKIDSFRPVIEEVSICRKAFQYLYQVTNEPISTERSDQYQQRKFNPDPLKNHRRNQPDPNPLKADAPIP